MSPVPAALRAREERPRLELRTAGIVAMGLALLVLRPLLGEGTSAVVLLSTTYVLLGTVSLVVAVPRSLERAMSPVLVVGIGLGAIVGAAFLAGPRPPAPTGPDALVLNSLAAVSEEAFFRRFLYGRLARYGAGVAIGVSALAFGLVHVPAYGLPALPVGLGAGLLLSWQRWASGTWLAPAATHLAANLLVVIA